MEAEEPVPARKIDLSKPDGSFGIESQPAGKKPKSEKKTANPLSETLKNGLPWFQGGKTLGKAEAETIQESLAEALLSDFEYIDRAIWGYTQDTDQKQLWSDIDKMEAETLARVLTRRGQRSPAAAAAVRGLVESQDYIDVGMIVVPRIHETVKRVRQAPKRERPPRPTRIARMRARQQQQEQAA